MMFLRKVVFIMVIRGYLYNVIPAFQPFDFNIVGPYRIVDIVGDYLDYTFVYFKSENGFWIGKFSIYESYIAF